MTPSPRPDTRHIVQLAGLVGGPLLALAAAPLLPAICDGSVCHALSDEGHATAAVAIWMAVWWLTEAIPVYLTAMLPIALLPLLGAASARDAAAPYGHELIYLFFGGFVVALSMERWGLHRRIAFAALRLMGTHTDRIIGGFMLISAGLSMWISNTATTIMLFPIALSVLDVMADEGEFSAADRRNLSLCLLLGVAYAASIGGIATLIGTPPNLFLASFVQEQIGLEIGFARWMAVGLPVSAVFLPLCWLLLTRVLYPVSVKHLEGIRSTIERAAAAQGRMSRGERITLAVFLCMALGWMFRPLLTSLNWHGFAPLQGLTDTGIAILAALALFVAPVNLKCREFVMNWKTALRLPWGVLLLFGGGLSLAAALQANGVSEYIGLSTAGLAHFPKLLIVLGVVTIVIFLTELTSNLATTATLLPVLAALGPILDINPIMLVVPATIAASCAFMLPVATPPNAIVFGSGRIGVGQMVRAGVLLNLIGIVLITGAAYMLVLPLLGMLWTHS
ncbi:MAG: DASS family sodium-coupled anion symporter [Alphaproteobacteria bacterium]|nr:MAG: DASS family sodium-coupled anion symporter [Alphaproteobacteria bacterium]